MERAVIVGGVRTAVGSFGGALRDVPAVELGSTVIRGVLQRLNLKPVLSRQMRTSIPDGLRNQEGALPFEQEAEIWLDTATPITVDEVIMGNVLQAGQGQNPARQAMIYAGLPKETPAFTVNKICGSGLKAITVAAASIMSGQADVIIAGGMENMSRTPFAIPKARWGHRMEVSGKAELTDLMIFDGLHEIFYGYHMGITAENIAKKYNISRQAQDELSVISHNRAYRALTDGLFHEEIVPVIMRSHNGTHAFDRDERPKKWSIEKLARMRPVFLPDGTVTAGNSSGLNDAAAAVLLMSTKKAAELGLEPILEVTAFGAGGVDPAYMGLGPIPAIRMALARGGYSIADMDLIELNEAFASQTIACMRELNISPDLPNQVGSGISIGHPIGCSGARQVVTGMYQMKRNNNKRGLFSICIGGGMGMAMIAERLY